MTRWLDSTCGDMPNLRHYLANLIWSALGAWCKLYMNVMTTLEVRHIIFNCPQLGPIFLWRGQFPAKWKGQPHLQTTDSQLCRKDLNYFKWVLKIFTINKTDFWSAILSLVLLHLFYSCVHESEPYGMHLFHVLGF